ncbi:MAG: glycosyltransferase family 9 protein [bacterium]|nr:glycosyltransferase family 9 protein [bacterium]
MATLLVIKTGALGDVLRTTSILPGLAARFDDLEVCWVTAAAAKPLVERHRLVDRVVTCDPKDPESIAAVRAGLADTRWDWLLSLDDEEPLCALAAGLAAEKLSGATLDQDGQRIYTDDVEPWFGMGLLARAGKATADARKISNQRTHPEIFATMFGIEPGRPELPLPDAAGAAARAFAQQNGLGDGRLLVGLNTGAGGRWTSKGLPTDRVVAYADALAKASGQPIDFLILGGPNERERNGEIASGIKGLGDHARAVDPGTDNDIPTFSAILGLCDLLLTSDSLALHLGVALDVPIVAFFAPTSAAEIELYGLGEKVVSTATDYCTYRPDADNTTITVERLVAATERVLAANAKR